MTTTATTANPLRTVYDTRFMLDAAPERVFPLLCPVVEYDWIPDWRCTMVHTVSGVAELGCVFLRGGETWITTRYEPPTRIDYAIFDPTLGVGTLEFTLTATGAGTTVDLHNTFTPTHDGTRGGAQTEEQHRALWALRRKQLEHYLRTGTMLPS